MWDVGKQQVGIGIECMSTWKAGLWGTSWHSDLGQVILTPHFVFKGLLSLFQLYFMRTSWLLQG